MLYLLFLSYRWEENQGYEVEWHFQHQPQSYEVAEPGFELRRVMHLATYPSMRFQFPNSTFRTVQVTILFY